VKSRGLDLFDGPSWVEESDASPPTADRVPAWSSVVGAAAVGLVLGYLGLVLPAPGDSLIIPTGIVAGVGTGIAVGGAILLAVGGTSRQSGLFAGLVLLFAGLTSVWTLEWSLPAQMAWDRSATTQAQKALRQVQHGPKNALGVSLHPCRIIQTGSIGPVSAPYRQCATSTFAGSLVFFSPIGTTGQGLAYTNIGSATFEDQCYRHLFGAWWAFNGGDLSNPGSPCSFGYSFHGGG